MFWTYNNNRSSPHSFISVGTQANGVSIRLLVCAHPDDQGHRMSIIIIGLYNTEDGNYTQKKLEDSMLMVWKL